MRRGRKVDRRIPQTRVVTWDEQQMLNRIAARGSAPATVADDAGLPIDKIQDRPTKCMHPLGKTADEVTLFCVRPRAPDPNDKTGKRLRPKCDMHLGK